MISIRKLSKLVPTHPVDLLGLALAAGHDGHLLAEGIEAGPDGNVLCDSESTEAAECIVGLCQLGGRIGNLLAQRLRPRHVAAEVQRKLLLMLGGLLGSTRYAILDALLRYVSRLCFSTRSSDG